MPLLNGKYAEATEIYPDKHKFIGTFRNPNYSDYQGKGYIACPCGSVLQTFEQSFSHWQLGHFDQPMYVDI